jgi:5'-nucleotidase / UDP-sugar diphosphatase
LQILAGGLIGLILLWFSAVSVFGQDAEIRILHWNDFHGFAEPHTPLGGREPLGGVAYLASRARELRREKPALFLAAGDMIQGHPWANLSRGRIVGEWLNAMGVDAMVAGNHEFDFGQEELRRRIAEFRFPVLGANVEGMKELIPHRIFKTGGISAAVIGVVTQDTLFITHPRNVAGLRFSSPEAALARHLPELRKKAEVVVLLSHIGHAADLALAEKVAGIDLIVGGHSHTRIMKPVRAGNTWIVQAWEHGKALGVLDLVVRNGKVRDVSGRLERIRPVPGREDAQIQALVEKHRRAAEAVLLEVLGETRTDLDGENGRMRETNLGNWIADILRSAGNAEVAVMNGGGIRMSIKRGEIRMKDLYAALPFDNHLVVLSLTGRQIRKTLEHGLSGVEENKGRFPQISGMTLTYAPSAPRGKRLREVLVGGAPMEPHRKYTLATNDFLAAGGDGYRILAEAAREQGAAAEAGRVIGNKKAVLRDLAAGFIRKERIIAPGIEGRIAEVERK